MDLEVFDLGLIDFGSAWQFQKDTLARVCNSDIRGALIICSHYPAITLGRLARIDNVLIAASGLDERKIPLYEIERGGDVTYHGPGQLTVYPVFNLNYFIKDIRIFLRQLEALVIDLLSDFGISGTRYPGLTGVWVEKAKIASIGIAIKRWVTYHGLSINITKDDLGNFSLIRPCGMDIRMTSLESVLGRPINKEILKRGLICRFKEKFSDIFR
ncbi:MAG: lipoyl(octanoyl) transferase LipB [Candidatus Omnitrophica bacterium]|nr:lipoyl(octanoyl) transferase LipB [Candidatus Omnitrophota bacterium]